ncbi:MAG: serine hydrolase [Candidatus Shapirobacteria bacterium]
MKNIPLKIIFLIIPLLIGVFIGKFILANSQPQDNFSKEVHESFNYQFISPLLECNSNSDNITLYPLKNSINHIINQEINSNNITFASVYFRDLNNGPWFGINEKEYFSPASLAKVPLLITYLKKAQRDSSLLSQKIINPENQEDGVSIQNIKPSETLLSNQEYTVEDLLKRMIIYSDNDSYNNLFKNIENNEILQVYKDLDIDISKILENSNGDIITVKDYASFFRTLFNASYLNQDMSEKALSLLSQVEYQKALVAGVPKNIKVAHKFGERKFLVTGEVQFHDCGIIYLPKKPYLLCIMTRSNDLNKAILSIKKMSQETFQYINDSLNLN